MTSSKARSTQIPVQIINISSLPHLPMTAESKQTNPLNIPRFTPADYGNFFLAGQFSSLKLHNCSQTKIA